MGVKKSSSAMSTEKIFAIVQGLQDRNNKKRFLDVAKWVTETTGQVCTLDEVMRINNKKIRPPVGRKNELGIITKR